MKKTGCLLFLICLLIINFSCGNDSSPAGSSEIWNYSPSEVKGWELDTTNTGIAAAGLAETDIVPFDLNGADAGKGEWIAGEGNILYLYGNQIIENKIFTFTGYIKAVEGNTIIRNCIIRPDNCADGMAMIWLSGATIENCEVDGSKLGMSNIAHAGISAANSVIKNCLIHDCDCGIMANNSSGLTIIENNFIYNILLQPGSDDHLAGISIWSAEGGGIGIFNNRVVIDDDATAGHTSAGFFSQSLQGHITNVRVDGNLIISTGYVTRITDGGYGTSLPFSFTDNRLQIVAGGYGYYHGEAGLQITPAWTENYIYDSNAEDARGTSITIN